MSLFRIGQMLKKSRGDISIGTIVVVVGFESADSCMKCNMTMSVKLVTPGFMYDLRGEFVPAPIGCICLADPDEFDPIEDPGLDVQEEQREEELV